MAIESSKRSSYPTVDAATSPASMRGPRICRRVGKRRLKLCRRRRRRFLCSNRHDHRRRPGGNYDRNIGTSSVPRTADGANWGGYFASGTRIGEAANPGPPTTMRCISAYINARVDLNWDTTRQCRFRKHIFYTLFESKKECKNNSIKALWPASAASRSGGGAGKAEARAAVTSPSVL